MADPRKDVSFEDIGATFATFKIDNATITYDATKTNGSDKVGLAVTLSDNETIETVGDGEAVIGKLIKVERDNFATVQVAGFMTLPAGNGATLTRGKKIVGDLGPSSAEGYIREVNTGQAAELGVARGFTVDNSDTSNVVVYL